MVCTYGCSLILIKGHRSGGEANEETLGALWGECWISAPCLPAPPPRWEPGASPCAHSQEAPLNSVVQRFYWGFTESRAHD